MVETGQDITQYAGSFQTVQYTVTDGVTPLDLSTVTEILWTFRPANASATVAYTMTAGDIDFVTDGTDGEIYVYLAEEDFTATHIGEGYYQLKIEGYASHDYIVAEGACTVHEALA